MEVTNARRAIYRAEVTFGPLKGVEELVDHQLGNGFPAGVTHKADRRVSAISREHERRDIRPDPRRGM